MDHPVYKGIQKIGYRQPTQIQRKAIPSILDGKDVVAMSRTGSGKTAAFVIPMLQKLKKRDTRGFRALLLSPTRELALQTFRVVKDVIFYYNIKVFYLNLHRVVKKVFFLIVVKIVLFSNSFFVQVEFKAHKDFTEKNIFRGFLNDLKY